MTNSQEGITHWYPASVAAKRPSAWWYWGRAVYVSRRDYWRITKKFLAVGIPPTGNPRIIASRADHFTVPLPDAACEAVCFGFGTHEIPTGAAREKLFSEAARILKPGGKVLLFEHGWDAHNYVIFGPVIHHVTKRQDWDKFLHERFDDVKYARSNQAVDLFAGTRR